MRQTVTDTDGQAVVAATTRDREESLGTMRPADFLKFWRI